MNGCGREGSFVSLCRLKKVAVDDASKTLNGLLMIIGSSIHPKTKNVDIWNVGTEVIYVNSEEEDATTSCFELWPSSSHFIRTTAKEAAKLRFICATGLGSNMNVAQQGDTV